MIHIEGFASQDMSYLSQFFAFVTTDERLTKVIPSFEEEWGYVNKFGVIQSQKGELVVAGEYRKEFPFTILLPEALNTSSKKIVDWSFIKDKIIKLQEEEAKIKEFFDNLTPQQ